MQDNKKYITISFVAAGFICWLFSRHVFELLWDLFRLPIFDWPILPHDIIGALAGIIVFIVFSKNLKINTFMNEVVSELSKVTWPPRKETILSTGVISVMLAICAIMFLGFDFLWGTLVNFLYK